MMMFSGKPHRTRRTAVSRPGGATIANLNLQQTNEWARLAELSRNVFGTPEWVQTWAGYSSEELHVLERRGVVLPLSSARRGPVRVVRVAGHGPADELGPICSPNERTAAVNLMVDTARELGADLFLCEQLPGDLPLPGRTLRRSASPVLMLRHDSWDELLAGCSANLRQTARRKPRRLEREHETRYRLATAATLELDLDSLFKLHRARWNRVTDFSRRERFHRAFAQVALERQWLRLWILELDGEPAAAWLGFRYAGVESYYQAGRDPRWDRLSIGFVLLLHTIRAALEEGACEYRFLRGAESYKYRFAVEDCGLQTVGVGLTRLGQAALALGVAADRVRGFTRPRTAPPPLREAVNRS
jgi:CelD/BcsL family acetyltransferase involved in cellulose biosynthesis